MTCSDSDLPTRACELKTRFTVITAYTDAPYGYDEDWSYHPNGELWQFLTNKRYEAMQEILHEGNPIQFKTGGKSLEPLIYSGDVCFIWPIQAEYLIADVCEERTYFTERAIEVMHAIGSDAPKPMILQI